MLMFLPHPDGLIPLHQYDRLLKTIHPPTHTQHIHLHTHTHNTPIHPHTTHTYTQNISVLICHIQDSLSLYGRGECGITAPIQHIYIHIYTTVLHYRELSLNVILYNIALYYKYYYSVDYLIT